MTRQLENSCSFVPNLERDILDMKLRDSVIFSDDIFLQWNGIGFPSVFVDIFGKYMNIMVEILYVVTYRVKIRKWGIYCFF